MQLTLIITLIVAIILVYNVFISTKLTPETTTYTSQTKNVGFTDNDSDNCPAYWENTDATQSAWSQSGGYVYDNFENTTVGWYQSLAVSSIYDGVYSATISAKFMLYDNQNLEEFRGRVYLDDGTDNNVIWETTSIENSSSYTSIENDVSSYITAAGTYYIRLEDNGTWGAGGDDGSTLEARWDDASLKITTYDDYVDPGAQSARDHTVALAWAGIGLMAVAIIIIAASMILAVVRGFGGAGPV